MYYNQTAVFVYVFMENLKIQKYKQINITYKNI